MTFLQIAYASQPFGFDTALLSNILMDARRANDRDDITGALIARGDLYLQMLEGPEEKVQAAYERILRDDRHVNVQPLLRRTVGNRLFPGWAMRDDPAHSWIWSIEDVRAGAVDRATEDEVLGIFEQLAAQGAVPPAPRG